MLEKNEKQEKEVVCLKEFLSIISESISRYFKPFKNVKGDIEKNPEKYVLIISTYEELDLLGGVGKFKEFKLPKGTVFILDNSEPLSESSKISEQYLMNWLRFHKIPVYRIHSSGHGFDYILIT